MRVFIDVRNGVDSFDHQLRRDKKRRASFGTATKYAITGISSKILASHNNLNQEKFGFRKRRCNSTICTDYQHDKQ